MPTRPPHLLELTMPKKQRLKHGKKPTNEHQKAKYAAHFMVAEANHRRRILKHLRRHPTDEEAIKKATKIGAKVSA